MEKRYPVSCPSTSFRWCSATVLASSTTSGGVEVQLEQVRAIEAPGVTHLKYNVVT
jgi:hypothetical protein